eukprot:m.207473 g.207473  ORF g.207473 m.207473 type:complete len:454 (-) comp18522_c0_seq4:131-1492(-)
MAAASLTRPEALYGLGLCGAIGLSYYFYLREESERHKRRKLKLELAEARQRVNLLEEQIAEQAENDPDSDEEEDQPPAREIRIWMDGAFDMMHYGHMNAFRQGASLGTVLVVGINSDESITACKGPPVMTEEERTNAVRSCKWVDVVEPNCPYIMNDEYLEQMIEKHNLDYIVHGDDPCIVDGKDVYDSAVKRGIYRTIPRTEGVSTTEIVGRMLLMTRDHHLNDGSKRYSVASKEYKGGAKQQAFHRRSKFLTTNRMLRLFSAGNRDPPKDAVVVYMDGAWDMFHAGHAKILEQARALGDYLIVGVHNDSMVNAHNGLNYPILNMQERVLSVLGCTHVDDVLIDAPWEVTREMIASLGIKIVCRGTKGEAPSLDAREAQALVDERYRVPMDLGMFRQLESPSQLTVQEIVRRIRRNEAAFRAKYERKMKLENEYYDNRYQDVPTSPNKPSDT